MKKLLIAVFILLLIVAGALFFFWSSLDGIVKTAIESYGSEATKTQVSVADVKLKLEDGAGTINGLNVANPAGFTDPYIFRLGAISLKLDIATVSKNPIVIDKLIINSPEIFYEIDKRGGSNVDALKRNLAASFSSSTAKKPATGNELKVVIRHLVVKNGKASLRIAALGGKEESVNLARMVLTDVGKKGGGATGLEVAQVLCNAILKNVQGAVAHTGVQQYLGKSVDKLKQSLPKGGLGGAVGGAAGSSAGKLDGAVKGLLGN